jgi:hypothetical protein
VSLFPRVLHKTSLYKSLQHLQQPILRYQPYHSITIYSLSTVFATPPSFREVALCLSALSAISFLFMAGQRWRAWHRLSGGGGRLLRESRIIGETGRNATMLSRGSRGSCPGGVSSHCGRSVNLMRFRKEITPLSLPTWNVLSHHD